MKKRLWEPILQLMKKGFSYNKRKLIQNSKLKTMAPNCCNFAPKENLDIFFNIMSKSLLKEEDNGAISRIGYLKMAQSHFDPRKLRTHTALLCCLLTLNHNRLVHLQVTSDCFKRQKLPLINEFCHPFEWVGFCLLAQQIQQSAYFKNSLHLHFIIQEDLGLISAYLKNIPP